MQIYIHDGLPNVACMTAAIHWEAYLDPSQVVCDLHTYTCRTLLFCAGHMLGYSMDTSNGGTVVMYVQANAWCAAFMVHCEVYFLSKIGCNHARKLMIYEDQDRS